MPPDVITAAAGKLDDPLVLDWAIGRYESLPRNAVDQRARMEALWFHDVFVAQLIDVADSDTLARLFRLLPPAHFANVTSSMVRRWMEWPDALAGAAARPLAANAPDSLLELFEAWLRRVERGHPLNVTRLYEVDLLADTGADERRREFFERLSTRALALPDSSFDKVLLLPVLFRVASALSGSRLEDLLSSGTRERERERARDIARAVRCNRQGKASDGDRRHMAKLTACIRS
jgi:hypothetical protein